MLVILLICIQGGCSRHRFVEVNARSITEANSSLSTFSEHIKTITALKDQRLADNCQKWLDAATLTLEIAYLQVYCGAQLLMQPLPTPQRNRMIKQLNTAFLPLVRQALADANTGLAFKLQLDKSLLLEAFTHFTLVEDITPIDPFTKKIEAHALGISLIGYRENTLKGEDVWYPHEGIYRAITAIPSIEQTDASNIPTLTVTLMPAANNTFWQHNQQIGLVAALGMPYLLLAEHAEIDKFELPGLLNADAAEHKLGIYAVEPLDENKTPILMIHGLHSNPLIWRRLTWAIQSDPLLSKEYQVWHAFYPSGPPPFYNAMLLRRELQSLLQTINAPASRKVNNSLWLIGHSMGGIISRTFVVDSGNTLWDNTFTLPFEELSLPDQQKQIFKEIFFLSPLAQATGAIFIETPHRGSETSEGIIGQLASAVIKIPAKMKQVFSSVWDNKLATYLTPQMAPYMTRTGPNSVRVLSPRHPLLKALSHMPPSVSSYSVIGSTNLTACGTPESCETISDGVVTYSSAHLETARQEIIVRSSHNAYQSPEAIKFVVNILTEAATAASSVHENSPHP